MKKKEYLEPIGVHVLLKPLDTKETDATSKYLMGKSQPRPDKGILVAVGSKCEQYEALKEAIGQIVIFRIYSPEEYKIDGEKLFLIEESDIMGIWHK